MCGELQLEHAHQSVCFSLWMMEMKASFREFVPGGSKRLMDEEFQDLNSLISAHPHVGSIVRVLQKPARQQRLSKAEQ